MTAANVSAQMNNVIEVENEYAPIVADANKINVLPDVEETKVNPGNIEYATTPQPVRKYIFQPMWAAQSDATVKGEKRDKGNRGGINTFPLLSSVLIIIMVILTV